MLVRSTWRREHMPCVARACNSVHDRLRIVLCSYDDTDCRASLPPNSCNPALGHDIVPKASSAFLVMICFAAEKRDQ